MLFPFVLCLTFLKCCGQDVTITQTRTVDVFTRDGAQKVVQVLSSTSLQTPFLTAELQFSNNFTFCNRKPCFERRSGFPTYMMRLHLCSVLRGNTWFVDECNKRTYAFLSEYYEIVYLKFCQNQTYRNVCPLSISDQSSVNFDWIVRRWLSINGLDISTNANNSVRGKKHFAYAGQETDFFCEKVELYFKSLIYQYKWTNDSNLIGAQRSKSFDFNTPFSNTEYSEIDWKIVPLCRTFFFGFSESGSCVLSHDYSEHAHKICEISPITMSLVAVLSVLVISANALVLAVALKSDALRNVTGIFKTHLAVADMMVGVVVLPGLVYQIYALNFSLFPHRLLTQNYFDAMGVFTYLSVCLSVCTLLIASIDRYIAIARPLLHRQGKYFTKNRAVASLLLVWIVSLVVAILPILLGERYVVTSSGYTVGKGETASFVYISLITTVLLNMWIVNGLTMCQLSKYFKSLKLRFRLKTIDSRTQSLPNEEDAVNNKECHKQRKIPTKPVVSFFYYYYHIPQKCP